MRILKEVVGVLLRQTLFQSAAEAFPAEHREAICPVTCYGRPHYVFVEICDRLFPDIPKPTIKSRMRNLGLRLLKAPQDIQETLRKTRPHLACHKIISLVSKQDVLVLEAYQDSRTRNERETGRPEHFLRKGSLLNSNVTFRRQRAKCFSTAVAPPTMLNNESNSRLSTNFLVENLLKPAPQTKANSQANCDRAEAGCAKNKRELADDISSDSDSEMSELNGSPDTDSSCDNSADETGDQAQPENTIVELIKKKNLDEASFGNVIQSLGEMKEFFQSDINFKRRQPKMSDSTWSKNLERLVIFLAYCVNRLKLDPCLQLVENMNVVDSFIKYIKQARRVKNNTAALYVNALIVASKFLHANERGKNYDHVESISDLRALAAQLNKEHAVLEAAKGPESRRLFWPQFQELTRSLHQQFEDEPSAVQKSRIHMNFTLLLLFAINPGRAKEFRTLRLASSVPDGEIDELIKKLPNGENLIAFTQNGVVRLIEKGYKTFRQYGPNIIEMGEFQFVDYHLKYYVQRSRPHLVQKGCTHDMFFVNKHGLPFRSAGSFSAYLAKIFRKNLGFHCTMNEMRHALVEHFRSSKDSSDLHLAESLARVCKHSLRTQINVYDRRTEPERRKRALHYLNQSAVKAIIDDIPGPSSAISDHELESEEEEEEERVLPAPGEICALIPSDVNPKSPEIFLAKVLKYNEDCTLARLAWFKEDAVKPNHYRFQVGHSVWEERVSSLIYPLDIAYNRGDGTYELRSSKSEIYQQLK